MHCRININIWFPEHQLFIYVCIWLGGTCILPLGDFRLEIAGELPMTSLTTGKGSVHALSFHSPSPLVSMVKDVYDLFFLSPPFFGYSAWYLELTRMRDGLIMPNLVAGMVGETTLWHCLRAFKCFKVKYDIKAGWKLGDCYYIICFCWH